MIENQNINSQDIERKISNTILFFLLIIRITDQYIPTWLFGIKSPSWYDSWYIGIACTLTVVLIWLNRSNLEKINIDKSFMILLLLGGCAWLLYLPTSLGILVFFVFGYTFWTFYNKTSYFQYSNQRRQLEIFILILLSGCTAFLPAFFYKLEAVHSFDVRILISAFLEAQLALVIFEEVLFRGVAWAFLKHIGLSDRHVIFAQAFLFWISHHKYIELQNPYLFWFSIPLNALLFGIMVWRSKSLTTSTISHLLYNFCSLLIIKTML